MPVKANTVKVGEKCPKCGVGKISDGPHYTRSDHDHMTWGPDSHQEGLAYYCDKCRWCGLIVPCADAKDGK